MSSPATTIMIPSRKRRIQSLIQHLQLPNISSTSDQDIGIFTLSIQLYEYLQTQSTLNRVGQRRLIRLLSQHLVQAEMVEMVMHWLWHIREHFQHPHPHSHQHQNYQEQERESSVKQNENENENVNVNIMEMVSWICAVLSGWASLLPVIKSWLSSSSCRKENITSHVCMLLAHSFGAKLRHHLPMDILIQQVFSSEKDEFTRSCARIAISYVFENTSWLPVRTIEIDPNEEDVIESGWNEIAFVENLREHMGRLGTEFEERIVGDLNRFDYPRRQGGALYLIDVLCFPLLQEAASMTPPVEPRSEFISTEHSISALRQMAMSTSTGFATLIQGPQGCGKSALFRDLDNRFQSKANMPPMLIIHMDGIANNEEEINALIGSVIPVGGGNFQWKAGPVGQAIMDGKWVLLENIGSRLNHSTTPESRFVARLAKLRPGDTLQTGSTSGGYSILVSDTFRLFATKTTREYDHVWLPPGGLLAWNQVSLPALTKEEISEILHQRFHHIADCIDRVLQSIDGIAACIQECVQARSISLKLARLPSMREAIKLCYRLETVLSANPADLQQSVFEVALAEAMDVFCGFEHSPAIVHKMVDVLCDVWRLPRATGIKLFHELRPATQYTANRLCIGRGSLPVESMMDMSSSSQVLQSVGLAPTGSTLRLLERVSRSIEMNEPVLLVGETGCGKTTALQSLAKLTQSTLIILNLSQQSDASELFGGFRPLDPDRDLRRLVVNFDQLFCAVSDMSKNVQFLDALRNGLRKKKHIRVLKLIHGGMQQIHQVLIKRPSEQNRILFQTIQHDLDLFRHYYQTEWTADEPEEDVHTAKRRKTASGGDSSVATSDSVRSRKLVFKYHAGVLVDAMRKGWWVLLDEINLAPSDILDALVGLLDERSLILPEGVDTDRNDQVIRAHSGFRVIAAMNPPTDVGKKPLPDSLRNRFSEYFVHDTLDTDDLVQFVDHKLFYHQREALSASVSPKDQLELCQDVAQFFVKAVELAQTTLVDNVGKRPRLSLRSLSRMLDFAAKLIPMVDRGKLHELKCKTNVSCIGERLLLLEGSQLSFLSALASESRSKMRTLAFQCLLRTEVATSTQSVSGFVQPFVGDVQGRQFIKVERFWIQCGSRESMVPSATGFVVTPSVSLILENISRALAAGTTRLPVLLQGPTSAGKTSMVKHLAQITGHQLTRINNHEHTDISEYLGSHVASETGSLVFQYGPLVNAVKNGDWVVLDELNLAPPEVLEALNRLLDDNRELYLAETGELIKAHPSFALFATQNPPGLYGGRKQLSAAFRARFVEIQVDEICDSELQKILEATARLPTSFTSQMVQVMRELQRRRQASNLFRGKEGFITARDLFRWASRRPTSREELGMHGFFLLGERSRDIQERETVREVIQEKMKLDPHVLTDEALYGLNNEPLTRMRPFVDHASIVLNSSMKRLLTLMYWCAKNHEPILLVGETGGGKTSACQLVSSALSLDLLEINCHRHSEASDFLGSYRPVRDRHLGDSMEREPKGLFEWKDGPLLVAMRSGHAILFDEVNMADEAVVERLNSVLEPERTLLLVEKGNNAGHGVECIIAHDQFRVFATMNPGGDFGKKELSPALRNRFTELWVSPPSSVEDFKPIIESVLCDQARFKPVVDAMTRFISLIYDQETKHSADEAISHASFANQLLSLRDVVTWTRFVVQCGAEGDKLVKGDKTGLDPMLAFVHGSRVVLLDGLLAGPTLGYPSESCKQYQTLWRFLVESVPPDFRALAEWAASGGKDVYAEAEPRTLEFGPFWIPLGNRKESQSSTGQSYSLDAPSASLNSMRVARALLMHRPVLLEGSPGIGKTTLVEALAQSSWNELFRVNLSEFTEISDLVGCDVPTGEPGVFTFKEGPLLTAMKKGCWLLLDELNLASQSVLEGLNSVLDHRKSIFVPELNEHIAAFPGFQLFGAQNPASEGSGRRRLPRSFLNRFTRVHIESPSKNDLLIITNALYPEVSRLSVLPSMINYIMELNDKVPRLVHIADFYWVDFNLRDLLRWCELMRDDWKRNVDSWRWPASETETYVADLCRKFVRIIVLQRLTSTEAVRIAIVLFQTCFGFIWDERPIRDAWSDSQSVRLGAASLQNQRFSLDSQNWVASISHSDIAPLILSSQLFNIQALIVAVSKGWPVAMSSQTKSTGKMATLKAFAALAGQQIYEIVVSGSADTSDLLGGYEQVDYERETEHIFERLERIYRHLLAIAAFAAQDQDIAKRFVWLEVEFREMTLTRRFNVFDSVLRVIETIIESFGDEHEGMTQITVEIEDIKQFAPRNPVLGHGVDSSKHNAHFRWKRGDLIQRAERGEWVVIRNANMIAPAVLDRLNPLLEASGRRLLIPEAPPHADGSPFSISIHPNFRIFLLYDTADGKLPLSKAIRNRCLQIHTTAVSDPDEVKSLSSAYAGTNAVVKYVPNENVVEARISGWKAAHGMASSSLGTPATQSMEKLFASLLESNPVLPNASKHDLLDALVTDWDHAIQVFSANWAWQYATPKGYGNLCKDIALARSLIFVGSLGALGWASCILNSADPSTMPILAPLVLPMFADESQNESDLVAIYARLVQYVIQLVRRRDLIDSVSSLESLASLLVRYALSCVSRAGGPRMKALAEGAFGAYRVASQFSMVWTRLGDHYFSPLFCDPFLREDFPVLDAFQRSVASPDWQLSSVVSYVYESTIYRVYLGGYLRFCYGMEDVKSNAVSSVDDLGLLGRSYVRFSGLPNALLLESSEVTLAVEQFLWPWLSRVHEIASGFLETLKLVRYTSDELFEVSALWIEVLRCLNSIVSQENAASCVTNIISWVWLTTRILDKASEAKDLVQSTMEFLTGYVGAASPILRSEYDAAIGCEESSSMYPQLPITKTQDAANVEYELVSLERRARTISSHVPSSIISALVSAMAYMNDPTALSRLPILLPSFRRLIDLLESLCEEREQEMASHGPETSPPVALYSMLIRSLFDASFLRWVGMTTRTKTTKALPLLSVGLRLCPLVFGVNELVLLQQVSWDESRTGQLSLLHKESLWKKISAFVLPKLDNTTHGFLSRHRFALDVFASTEALSHSSRSKQTAGYGFESSISKAGKLTAELLASCLLVMRRADAMDLNVVSFIQAQAHHAEQAATAQSITNPFSDYELAQQLSALEPPSSWLHTLCSLVVCAMSSALASKPSCPVDPAEISFSHMVNCTSTARELRLECGIVKLFGSSSQDRFKGSQAGWLTGQARSISAVARKRPAEAASYDAFAAQAEALFSSFVKGKELFNKILELMLDHLASKSHTWSTQRVMSWKAEVRSVERKHAEWQSLMLSGIHEFSADGMFWHFLDDSADFVIAVHRARLGLKLLVSELLRMDERTKHETATILDDLVIELVSIPSKGFPGMICGMDLGALIVLGEHSCSSQYLLGKLALLGVHMSPNPVKANRVTMEAKHAFDLLLEAWRREDEERRQREEEENAVYGTRRKRRLERYASDLADGKEVTATWDEKEWGDFEQTFGVEHTMKIEEALFSDLAGNDQDSALESTAPVRFHGVIDPLHVFELYARIYSCQRIGSKDDMVRFSLPFRVDACKAILSIQSSRLDTDTAAPSIVSESLPLQWLLAVDSLAEISGVSSLSTAKLDARNANFYREPNVNEMVQASLVVQALREQLVQIKAQLLEESHAVLERVLYMTNKFLSLPISSPLGSVVSVLELLIREGTEWDTKYASKDWKLEANIKKVGFIVLRWRSLEIASWPSLLRSRKQAFLDRGKKWFLHMYECIICPVRADAGSLDSTRESKTDIFQVVDQFMRTCPVGELSTRLAILNMMVHHLTMLEMYQDHRSRLMIGSVDIAQVRNFLYGMNSYFSLFRQTIDQHMESSYARLECRMKELGEFAKWDKVKHLGSEDAARYHNERHFEYYRLKNFAERSKRSLHKICRELDACLETPCLHIIQQQQTTLSSLIKLREDKAGVPYSKKNGFLLEYAVWKNTWTEEGDSYGTGVHAPKVHRICQLGRSIESNGYHMLSAVTAYDLRQTIKSRTLELAALPTSSVDLKQKALSDLFRALKDHGVSYALGNRIPEERFSAKSWLSTPSFVQYARFNSTLFKSTMMHLDQLETLERTFYACGASMSSLRERAMGTSLHEDMSRRNATVALGIVSHMFDNLCIERSSLVELMRQLASLDQLVFDLGCFSSRCKDLGSTNESCESRYQAFETLLVSLADLRLLRDATSKLELIVTSNGESESTIHSGSAALLPFDARVSSSELKACQTSLSQIISVLEDTFKEVGMEKLGDVASANVFAGYQGALLSDTQKVMRTAKDAVLKIGEQLSDAPLFTMVVSKIVNLLESGDEVRLEEPLARPHNAIDSGRMAQASVKIVEDILLGCQHVFKSQSLDVHPMVSSEEHLPAKLFVTTHAFTKAMPRLLNLESVCADAKALMQDLDLKEDVQLDSSVLHSITILHCFLKDFVVRCINLALLHHGNQSDLLLTLIRLFDTLCEQGFCRPPETAEGDDEDDTDEKLTEVQGTGLADVGDGDTSKAKNISDEIEDETELLDSERPQDGTQQEQEQNRNQNGDKDRNDDSGVEMKTDFDAELQDLSDGQDGPDEEEDEDDDSDDSASLDDLEKQFGEGADANEIDEKLWDNPGSDSKEPPLDESDEMGELDSDVAEDVEKEYVAKDEQPESESGGDKSKQAKRLDQALNDAEAPDKEDAEMLSEQSQSGDEGDEGDEGDDDQGPKSNESKALGTTGEDQKDIEMVEENEEEEQIDLDPTKPMDQDLEKDLNDEEISGASSAEDADAAEKQADGETHEKEVEPKDEALEPVEEEKPKEPLPSRPVEQAGLEHSNDMNDEDPLIGNQGGDFHRSGKDVSDNLAENVDTQDVQDQHQGPTNSASMPLANDNTAEQQDGSTIAPASSQMNSDASPERSVGNPDPSRVSADELAAFWNQKLRILEDQMADATAEPPKQDDGANPSSDQEYAFSREKHDLDEIALAAATEEQQRSLQGHENKDSPVAKEDNAALDRQSDASKPQNVTEQQRPDVSRVFEPSLEDHGSEPMENDMMELEATKVDVEDRENLVVETRDPIVQANLLDTLQLGFGDGDDDGGILDEKADEARSKLFLDFDESNQADPSQRWMALSRLTANHAMTLAEQLRLVLEPTIATRLAGDFRTGKRLNMRRVIEFVASDFRRDRIWLRRTLPEKRAYDVMIAIDDSESMLDSGAGILALEALSLLSQALLLVEAGRIAVCRFGAEPQLLHNFDDPPLDEVHGAKVVNSFSFRQRSTDVAELLKFSIALLDQAQKSNSQSSAADIAQLLFVISDGRLSDREKLRTLVRDAAEKRQLIAFILVDGASSIAMRPSSEQKSRQSIMQVQKVEYVSNVDQTGIRTPKMKVSPYMDDFPFPFYAIVNQVDKLPYILGDALRQWFELLAQK